MKTLDISKTGISRFSVNFAVPSFDVYRVCFSSIIWITTVDEYGTDNAFLMNFGGLSTSHRLFRYYIELEAKTVLKYNTNQPPH